MRGAITPTTIFGTVIMARQGSSSLILVVEGDDDHFMIKDHVNDNDVILIGGNGRPKLLEAAVKAERRGVRGVRFLIDSDYDRYTQPTLRYPSNVIASENHDAMVDVVLANPSVLNRVIASYGRSVERRGGNLDCDAVRRAALTLAGTVAPLRVVNERRGHNLNLRDFPFGRLTSTTPTDEDLAALVVERSNTTLTEAQLVLDIASERLHLGTSAAVLIGDHDLFRALARVLSEYGVSIRSDFLWSGFMSAVDCAELVLVHWFQALADWGAANSLSTFNCKAAA